MSDLLSIATIALAGIVQASLQLCLGGLILLYHSSMGRHKRRKTRYLAKSYIWGAAAISFIIVCAGAFAIMQLMGTALRQEWMMIAIGALGACTLVMWLLYYRKGRGTELWVPKSISRYIARRARQTNDNVEAFSLGMLSAFAELPITIAIYFVVANCLLNTSMPMVAALVYVALVIMPMFILKLTVKSGQNVVAVQKWRIQNKAFLKIISGSGFAVLAMFIVAFWVM